MHVYARLTILTVLLSACSPRTYNSVSASTSIATNALPRLAGCAPNRTCELVGTLTLRRGTGTYSWAALSNGDACAPLLMPERVYAEWRRWDGKRVRVRGTALARPSWDPPELLQVQLRDRWLFSNVCAGSDLALYVDALEFAR